MQFVVQFKFQTTTKKCENKSHRSNLMTQENRRCNRVEVNLIFQVRNKLASVESRR